LYQVLSSLAVELQVNAARAEGITAAEVRGELQPYLLEAEDRCLAIFEPYIELWPQAVKCKQEVERHIWAQLRVDYLTLCQLSDEQLKLAIERLELERPGLAEQLSTLIAREYPGVWAELQCRMQEARKAEVAESQPADPTALQATISLYTGGISDDRLRQVAAIVSQQGLTVNERLQRINDVLPIPATASLQDVADLFGVKKQAVHQTDWWQNNRAGKDDSEKEQRRRRLAERAKLCPPDSDCD